MRRDEHRTGGQNVHHDDPGMAWDFLVCPRRERFASAADGQQHFARAASGNGDGDPSYQAKNSVPIFVRHAAPAST